MAHFFSLIIAAVITLVLLVPFGFAAMYVFISLKQLMIAEKEKSEFKRKGGAIALLLAIAAMLLLLLFWLYIISKL